MNTSAPAAKLTSLNRKLIISVVLAAIGFTFLVLAVLYMTELDRSRDKTRIMLNQLLDTVEYTSAIAAYTNNEQIAREVVQGLMRNDIVQEVLIAGDQGLQITQSKNNTKYQVRAIKRKLLSPFDNRQVIGSISVLPRGDYNLAEATHSALLSAINSLLLISLTAIIIFWVFRRNIVQPLTLVSNTLHEISAGEKHRLAPLSDHNNDELGRLIDDINALLIVLESNLINERTLREKIEHIEKKLRTIFDSTSAGLFQLDQQGRIVTHNPTFMKFLVSDPAPDEGLIGCHFGDSFLENPSLFQDMLDTALCNNNLVSNDFALKIGTGNDKPRWLHCLLSRLDNSGEQQFLEGVIFDVSKRIASEKAIRYQAEYDTLTGLLRRNSIERSLSESLLDPKQVPLVLMLMDLDDFKAINDTYGHDAGDEVLVEVSQRFKRNIRNTDVIGRLGGDEFVIILNQCEPVNAELTIARKIIAAVREPMVLKSKITVHIGVSIGMALNTNSNASVESLMKAADDAMYIVKRQGKNGLAVNKGEQEITVEIL